MERSATLAKDLKLTFPLLSDSELKIGRAFGVVDAENGVTWPSVFLLDGEGRVRWRDLSATYKLRPRPETIFQAIDAMGAP